MKPKFKVGDAVEITCLSINNIKLVDERAIICEINRGEGGHRNSYSVCPTTYNSGLHTAWHLEETIKLSKKSATIKELKLALRVV